VVVVVLVVVEVMFSDGGGGGGHWWCTAGAARCRRRVSLPVTFVWLARIPVDRCRNRRFVRLVPARNSNNLYKSQTVFFIFRSLPIVYHG
jgi:hypothetical protein